MDKIFLACTGLGRINRGYETFTQECFDVLSQESSFETFLFKGKGAGGKREFAVSNLHRDTKLAKWLGKLIGKDGYFIEQLSFVFVFFFYILRFRPSIIFYSDFILGTFLWRIRKLFGLKYELLFSNGAPNGPPFARCDYVQQLLPSIRKEALDAGEVASKHFLLPYGIQIDLSKVAGDKIALRKKLGLPLDKQIIISVGAINKSHKRMDYLVKEIAKLNNDNFYLVILGQIGEESAEIRQLAQELLPTSCLISTVLPSQISEYYQAADLFVLCSLTEGFGRVYIEALKYGLPVFAHDYAVCREVLGEYGLFSDFTKNMALANLIHEYGMPSDEKIIRARSEYVFEKYSWDKLKAGYVAMLNDILKRRSN